MVFHIKQVLLFGVASIAPVLLIVSSTSAPARADPICSSTPGRLVTPTDVPRLEGDSLVFRDGTRIRASTPDGRPAAIVAGGTVRYADGTTIMHNSDTHETAMINAAGTIVNSTGTMRRGGPARWTWQTARNDEEDSDWIRYPDGTTVSDALFECPEPDSGAPDEAEESEAPEFSGSHFGGHGGRCAPGSAPHRTVTPSDVPRRVGDNIIYRDGTRVRALDPLGRPGRINADGSVTYPDGTRVAHNSDTGFTSITTPDGNVSRTNVRTPGVSGSEFVWNDGMRAPATDPSGGRGTVQPDGTIAYPDGTRISHDPRTGMTETTRPDGTTSSNRWSGARRDDSGTWRWNDGTGAPGTDPGGGAGSENGDGWIRYPDGTLISHHAGTGESKYVRSDGTVTLVNDCEDELRLTASSCLPGPSIIDRCMVGTWESSAAAFMQDLQAMGIPITRDSMGSMRLTINEDGTFLMQPGAVDFGMTIPYGPDGPVIADTTGSFAGSLGYWSASRRNLKVCFISGGNGGGRVNARYPDGRTARPDFVIPPTFAGMSGDNHYNCSGDNMTISLAGVGSNAPVGPRSFQWRRVASPSGRR